MILGARLFRRLALLAALFCLAAGPFACAPAALEAEAPAPTFVPATPTPAPVVSCSALRIASGAPESVPAFYTAVTLPGLPSGAFYAFTDAAGAAQYRVWAERDELTNGVLTETERGFAAAELTRASEDEAYSFAFADAGGFASDAPEQAGVCAPVPLPEGFVPRRVYEPTGLTGHLRATDTGACLVYGSFGEAAAAFYPADEAGQMLPGALPDTGRVLVPAYTPMDTPLEGDPVKLVIYIGSQSVVAYRAVDGEWVEARVMLCSTGKSADDTPRGDFRIMEQYLYKKLGMNNENLYGQYSSRITGSYLFHSVPITGPNPQNRENGKRQMSVKYYDRLGTPASGGCVRMRVLDALWIYTYCTVGTPVTVTDDAGPAPAQPAPLIEEEPYQRRVSGDYHGGNYVGWDPSDPDPNNPYAALYPTEDWAVEAFAAADATDPQKKP